MIEERDLDAAVSAGILDAATRERLVTFARDHRRGMAGPDEESFRLLTGFNDIFVTIAIGLLLFAVGSLGGLLHPALGAAAVALLSWGLAEYFTRQRRMALPSIVLLLAFVGGVFGTVVTLLGGTVWGTAGAPLVIAVAAAPPRPPRPMRTGDGSWCRSPSPPGSQHWAASCSPALPALRSSRRISCWRCCWS